MDKIEIRRAIKFLHFQIKKNGFLVWDTTDRTEILWTGRDNINKQREDEQLKVDFHVTFLQNWLNWSRLNWFVGQPEVFYIGGLQ